MQNQHPLKLYGAIVLSMVLFSLSFVWFKVANVSYGPLTIVLFRLVVSSGVLFVFAKLSKRFVLPSKRDFKFILLLALFEPFLYFMGESYGLQYISPTVGAVIIATIPLVAPVAAFLFYREKISPLNIFGILVSFVGVTMVIFELGVGISASPIGVLLQFSAVFSAVMYTIVLHKISAKINNLSILFFQNLLGSIYFLPFWLVFEKDRFLATPIDNEAFLAIVYLALFVSSVAFILFTFSVRHMGITKANMFANTIPVFTAFFSWIMLGDGLTLQKIIGIVVVIAGLFIGQIKLKKNYRGPDPLPEM